MIKNYLYIFKRDGTTTIIQRDFTNDKERFIFGSLGIHKYEKIWHETEFKTMKEERKVWGKLYKIIPISKKDVEKYIFLEQL